jgi:integrase
MRRGEILGLQWRDIDHESRTARLHLTKNGDGRDVPLGPTAVGILTMRWEGVASEGTPSPTSLVFPISANAVRLAWSRLLKRSGVDDLRFHDLRHEAVSRFFELGLTLPEVGLISGHRDARMLLRYTHLKPRAVAEKQFVGQDPERCCAAVVENVPVMEEREREAGEGTTSEKRSGGGWIPDKIFVIGC